MNTQDYFYFAWYFDFENHPYQYGYSYWVDRWEPTYINYLDLSSSKRIGSELLKAESATVSSTNFLELIKTTIARECPAQPATVLFDNSLATEHLIEQIDYSTTVDRKGLDAIQVLKSWEIIKSGNYVIPDKFLYTPDLIFPEYGGLNIIDPVISDQQTTFPMTQSLLIFIKAHSVSSWDFSYPYGSYSTSSY